MEKFIKSELKLNQQISILGGRRVVKKDLDGDGKWDVKYVFRNDGRLKRIVWR